jgi:hypothetical protein
MAANKGVRMTRSIIASGLVLVAIILAAAAAAQPGAGAVNLAINTSPRAEALGGAGAALPWDGNPAHWANPALLGFRRGIHYLDFRSELARGLADDILLTNKELVLGAFGVGLLIAQGPLDGNYLDMGIQQATDENGELVGEFESYMKSESWGLSLDAVEAAELVLGKGRGAWSRYASLSGGIVWKEFEDMLAPDSILQDGLGGGSGRGNCRDQGWMIRVTPLNLGFAGDRLGDGLLGIAIGGAYGAATLNKTDEFIVHVDADQADPFPTAHVKAWSLRLAVPWTENARRDLNAASAGILGDMLDPFLSFTVTRQKIEPGIRWVDETEAWVYERDTSGIYDEKGWGWEVGLANVLYLREGRLEVPYGDVDGATRGWGLNLQAGRFGGFRYDAATVPQARGLPTVDRRTWSVWVDPVAIFME